MLISGFHTSLSKEGQLRTSQKTESTIQNCFHLATESGAHKKVDKIVSSGVRDSLSHSTVERVIEKGKELRGRGRYKGKATAKPENEIVAQLKSMLEIGASRINPLLSMEGALLLVHDVLLLNSLAPSSLFIIKVWRYLSIRQPKFFTLSCLAS